MMKRVFKYTGFLLVLLLLAQTVLLPASAESLNAYLNEDWLQDSTSEQEVPLYYQTDYPDIPYGKGTISTSGCGITCLAMVVSYLQDRECLPPELAETFGQLQMNNVKRINHAIEVMDLPLESMAKRWEQMAAALYNGQIVILLVNEKSIFTNAQHFLVLTGMTKNGKVLVNDPYKPNYNDPELVDGFINGFSQEDMDAGFDGGWIFSRKTLPPELAVLEATDNAE